VLTPFAEFDMTAVGTPDPYKRLIVIAGNNDGRVDYAIVAGIHPDCKDAVGTVRRRGKIPGNA